MSAKADPDLTAADEDGEDASQEEAPHATQCRLCGMKPPPGETLKDRNYCEVCREHLEQAYRWLQSPMISNSELKALQKRILELTDIRNIKLE